MVTYGFHPEALAEYSAAAARRLQEGSPQVAEAFVSSVESAVQTIISDPARWRVAEEPGIRRYVLRRFPYVIYYRWEAERLHVTIYAVMHCSREPGYWKDRTA